MEVGVTVLDERCSSGWTKVILVSTGPVCSKEKSCQRKSFGLNKLPTLQRVSFVVFITQRQLEVLLLLTATRCNITEKLPPF